MGAPPLGLRAACAGAGEAAGVGEPRPTAPHSVPQELEDLQKNLPWYLRNLFSEDTNVLVWHALLLPVSVPGMCDLGQGPGRGWVGLGKNFPCLTVRFYCLSHVVVVGVSLCIDCV